MNKLTDTVKISIIVTAFSTLMIMITCILYKLSKLREVLDREPSMDGSLVTIGLPWRRGSVESARNSECSICNKEAGELSSEVNKKQDLPTSADQEDGVYTGRVIMNIAYNANTQTLVLQDVTGEDLLPWNYSSSLATYVLVDFRVGDRGQQIKSETVMGVQKACYERNFEFKSSEDHLESGQLNVSVLEGKMDEDIMVGECNICLEEMELRTTPNTMVAISRRLFKRASGKSETEVLLSLSYLPTAERLSVVVMKAKNIELGTEETITKNRTTVPNPYVKVCLIYAGRKIKKKKTSVKRYEKNPVYNESMIFDVPANFLHKIGFLITVEHRNFETEQSTVLGRIVIGSPVHNQSLRHWNKMLAFPRRPIAAWHKVFHLG